MYFKFTSIYHDRFLMKLFYNLGEILQNTISDTAKSFCGKIIDFLRSVPETSTCNCWLGGDSIPMEESCEHLVPSNTLH